MQIVPKKIILLAITLMFIVSLFGCTKKTNIDVQEEKEVIEEGKILITVMDKESKKPLKDAKIVIVGIENEYKTDDKGLSPEINLTINKDIYKKYGESLLKKAPSGCATVLITKEGYKDYVIFNKAVYPGYTANTLNIGLVKISGKDKENYTIDVGYPHETWIQELVEYCKNIKEENPGSGENKVSVTVKNEKSKPIEDALVFIPEVGIKVKTDKTGKGILKPGGLLQNISIYPIPRSSDEYTIVVIKDEYKPTLIFNTSINKDKDNNINITLNTSKSKNGNEFTLNYQPFEKEWIEKIISSYKE